MYADYKTLHERKDQDQRPKQPLIAEPVKPILYVNKEGLVESHFLPIYENEVVRVREKTPQKKGKTKYVNGLPFHIVQASSQDMQYQASALNHNN
jgi:hypothetical protein